jgi:hypothetical protein
LIVLFGLACLFAFPVIFAAPVFAENWTVVYQTDCSADPGWTTNNSAHFYWDSATQTFFQSQKNGSEEYAYKLLPSSLESGEKWRLDYDIKVTSENWAANAGVAIIDSHTSHQVGAQMMLDFAHIDAGYRPFLEWRGDQAEFSASYSLNHWYHALLQWDPTTGTLYGRVSDRDTGALLSEKSVSGLGTFSGIDRVAMTTVDHTYATGMVATAYLDNITVSQTPEPATLSLLALGGAALLRRKRATEGKR